MKKARFAFLAGTILCLSFAVAVPTYAQEEEKPRQDDKHVQDDKTTHDRQQEENKDVNRGDRHDDKQVQGDKKMEGEKHAQDDHGARHQERGEGKDARHERIPEDRFRAHFGREHVFVINRPVIAEGTPRFQYGGYWFVIAQPWPVGWAYADQVYVDDIDGQYYLLSPVHPGVQISINVVF